MRPVRARGRMWVTQVRKGTRALILVYPRRVVAWPGGEHLGAGDDSHASMYSNGVLYATHCCTCICYQVSRIGKKITKSSLPQHRQSSNPKSLTAPLPIPVITPVSPPTPTDDDEQLTILHENADSSRGLFPISLSLLFSPSSSILSHHGECGPPLPSATVRTRPALNFPMRVLTVLFIFFPHC